MFVWGLLLFECFVGAKLNFDVYLQPGHVNHEYDSVEEVRSHNDTTSVPEKVTEDQHLMKEAILDVAYYLRRFKFSGYDPRYLIPGEHPRQNLFVEFPNPQLRNIQWEVKKNCEPSFVECVKYLQEKVSQTILPRQLDSITIARRNGWSLVKDEDLIKSANDECLKLLENDQSTFDVFSSPLQRFQWLTSASYYMCWYTMRENSLLRVFADECDNYAACIAPKFGLNNKDVRANNKEPFACAQYSFCPDPCCPLRHTRDKVSCQNAGPCSGSKIKLCLFSRNNNAVFEGLMLNQWNVTCRCDQKGMRWESKSGMCVDVNECLEPKPHCDYPSESCRNLPGTYKCVCNMLGYRQGNDTTRICEKDPVLYRVFHPPSTVIHNKTRTGASRNAAFAIKSIVSKTLNLGEQKPSANRTRMFGEGLKKPAES